MSFKTSAQVFAVLAIALAGSPALAREDTYGHVCGPRAEACRHSSYEACTVGDNCAADLKVAHPSRNDWPNDLILG